MAKFGGRAQRPCYPSLKSAFVNSDMLDVWCRFFGLQPDKERTEVHGPPSNNSERQTVPGLDVTVTSQPSLYKRQDVP